VDLKNTGGVEMLIYIKPDKEPVRIGGEKTVVITAAADGFKVQTLISDVMDCSYATLPLEASMFVASEHLQGRDPDKATVLRLSKPAQQSESRQDSEK